MYSILEIVFWLCAFCIFHTYVLFPIILRLLAKNKKNNTNTYQKDSELPRVSILLAVFNEESVIEKKLESTFKTNYPADLFDVYIGSDNSTDKTDEIISEYCKKHKNLHLYSFKERRGKPGIINDLHKIASGEVLILTDANVYFNENTIFELVKHYKNPEISLVGGLIENTNIKKSGISYQEKTYLSGENNIKYNEGVLWGCMIGAFGGVYSIRKSEYEDVPKKYFVDDFYITMRVLESGKKAIVEPAATALEDVSNVIGEEFKRKVRISSGNFQNLSRFWKMTLNPFSGKGFSFISHKILRWKTPFFIIICLVISAVLFSKDVLYSYLFFCQIGLLLLPIVDLILKSINVNIAALRFVTHFVTMNAALLIGFFKYIKGIESNVWQPTKRNQ